MRMSYLGRLAISACLLLATSCTPGTVSENETVGDQAEVVTTPTDEADPCASSKAEVVAEPCAGANPCASADPGAAAATLAEADANPTDPADYSYFVGDNGLAIRGADPVAYFTEGAAVTGSPEFTYDWGDATWQFASAENRDLFAANPKQYAPQYGGFCAWAVSQGYTASIDPNAWRIVEGRLYLNYSPGVQQRWERDIPGNISSADANWPGVLSGS